MITYWKEGFQKYIVFNGRATRAQYWSWVFVNIGIYLVAVIIALATKSIKPLPVTIVVLLSIYSLATIIPGLAYTVRRLHDANLTGWLVLLSLVPYIGSFVILILTLLPSQNTNNKYGPHPLTAQSTFNPTPGYYPPYPPGTPSYSSAPYPPQGSYFPPYSPPQGPPTQPGTQQVNPYQSYPFSPQQNYPPPQSPQPSPQPNFPSYPLNPEVPPPNNPTNPENQSDQP